MPGSEDVSYTIGSEESFNRVDRVVRWGLKQIGEAQDLDPEKTYVDIPIVEVKITGAAPDADGYWDGKFVVRDLSTTPHSWRDIDTTLHVCKVEPIITLASDQIISGFVTERKNGYPIVIPISGGSGDVVEVGEPLNDGAVPPLPKLMSWRILYYNLTTDDFDPGPAIWARDANA